MYNFLRNRYDQDYRNLPPEERSNFLPFLKDPKTRRFRGRVAMPPGALKITFGDSIRTMLEEVHRTNPQFLDRLEERLGFNSEQLAAARSNELLAGLLPEEKDALAEHIGQQVQVYNPNIAREFSVALREELLMDYITGNKEIPPMATVLEDTALFGPIVRTMANYDPFRDAPVVSKRFTMNPPRGEDIETFRNN